MSEPNEIAGEIEFSYEGVKSLDEVFARVVAAIRASGNGHNEVLLNLDTESLDEEFPGAIKTHADAVRFLFELVECGRKYGISIQTCPHKKVIHLIYQPPMGCRVFVHAPETSH